MKALVMEIREDKAIVLKDDGTFEKIKNAGYSVGESIDIKKSPKIIRFSRKFSAIAAIVAVFVLVGSVYAYAYVTPYTSYTETTDDGGTEITYTVVLVPALSTSPLFTPPAKTRRPSPIRLR